MFDESLRSADSCEPFFFSLLFNKQYCIVEFVMVTPHNRLDKEFTKTFFFKFF